MSLNILKKGNNFYCYKVDTMNKKEAVAYAQIALNYMLSSKYNGEINPETFGIEMRQAFRLYPRDIVLNIAESQSYARKKLQDAKSGCDSNE